MTSLSEFFLSTWENKPLHLAVIIQPFLMQHLTISSSQQSWKVSRIFFVLLIIPMSQEEVLAKVDLLIAHN